MSSHFSLWYYTKLLVGLGHLFSVSKLYSEGNVCFLFGWTAVYFHAEMMLLFPLEINSNSAKQIQYYMSILRSSKVLVRIESHAYFLVFENTVAECWPTCDTDASWHRNIILVKVQGFTLTPILLNRHDFTLTLSYHVCRI